MSTCDPPDSNPSCRSTAKRRKKHIQTNVTRIKPMIPKKPPKQAAKPTYPAHSPMVDYLRSLAFYKGQLDHDKFRLSIKLPGREAEYQALDEPSLFNWKQYFKLDTLYKHQYQAVQAVLHNQDVVVSTSTASGKSLCYNLPVLSDIAGHQGGINALYLFPTKALARVRRGWVNVCCLCMCIVG